MKFGQEKITLFPLLGVPVHIMSSPWDISYLKSFLDTANLPYKIVISDLQDLINEGKRINDAAREKVTNIDGYAAMEWTSYHTYEEVGVGM